MLKSDGDLSLTLLLFITFGPWRTLITMMMIIIIIKRYNVCGTWNVWSYL